MAHTGKMPFKCDICEQQFTYVETYKSHMDTHVANRLEPQDLHILGTAKQVMSREY